MVNKRKYILYSSCAAITILLLLVLFFLFVPISRDLDISVMGIQCENGDISGAYEEKEIQINGKYKHYLFYNKPDSFNGEFLIDGYDLSNKCEASFFILPQKEQTANPLIYTDFYSDPDNIAQTHAFGLISTKPFLSEFLIRIAEPIDGSDGQTWDNENGTIIIAPANDRQEAIEKAKLLCESSSITWN